MNKRKGFTLIELMVVIVIIGILAAIAIPKLFGMSAKAKASEAGPAAGTWSKLLQAYVLETAKLGDAVTIGYTPPGNTKSANFGSTANFGYTIFGNDASAWWRATNMAKLNDCTSGNYWVVTAGAQSGGSAQSVETLSMAIGGVVATPSQAAGGDCGNLTPNFGKLQ